MMKKKYIIAVVDEDVHVQELVSKFFSSQEFQVHCFCSPQEAIENCKSDGSKWDVLLTNFHFPKMTGIEFTLAIRKLLPDIPIILLSPLETVDVAIEAINKGAYDYIVKPINLSQLQISVQRAIHLKNLKEEFHELSFQIKSLPSKFGTMTSRSKKFIDVLILQKEWQKVMRTFLSPEKVEPEKKY
jgi:DNA-binding NtrC family response regulator